MSELSIQNERATRVVIVTSDPAELLELRERLGRNRNFLVKAAVDVEELKTLLDAENFDVALIAPKVAGKSAIEVNDQIKTFYRSPPATILYGDGGDIHAVIKAFRCGFVDCLPFEASANRETELRDAVMRAARIVGANREQNQHVRDLERLAQRDSVTGLVNRHYLRERLDQLIAIGRRHGTPFAAILIRVNNLEQIRGAFGSKVGDAVLHAFGKRLNAAARKSATFGRLNDDTFLYLVEQEVTEENIAGACSRLGGALSFALDLDSVSLSLSASVAAGAFPANGATIADILEAAEAGIETQIAAMLRAEALATGADFVLTGKRPVDDLVTAGAEAAGQTAEASRPTPYASNVIPATRLMDRRNALRRRCLKRGMLVFNNGFSTVNCIVRDLSDTGARLEVQGGFDEHSSFELRLIESGLQYKAEKRWQSGNKFGVRFLA